MYIYSQAEFRPQSGLTEVHIFYKCDVAYVDDESKHDTIAFTDAMCRRQKCECEYEWPGSRKQTCANVH